MILKRNPLIRFCIEFLLDFMYLDSRLKQCHFVGAHVTRSVNFLLRRFVFRA